MKMLRVKIYLLVLFFLFSTTLLSLSQSKPTLEELLEKNVQAAGGKEKLSTIENYAFKHGTTSYYMSADGLMKITEGQEPIVKEVIIADQNKVRRNCFNQISEISGLEKSTYQCLAGVRCGLFTLIKFKDQLDFKGIKKFGPKEYYLLTTNIDDLRIEFYLDGLEFTLKRIVFQGFDQAGGKYEVNHDLGPYQEVNGVKIPSSWFGSRVGTRGRTHEIAEVKMNLELEKNFFSDLEVKVGKIKVDEGALQGNVIEFMFRRDILMIATNWTKDCLQRAGFKTGNKLILQADEKKIEIEYYESMPPRETLTPGKKFMIPNQRSENYLVYLWSADFKELEEKLEPLLPIQVRRK
ncbi:MAG: hypothetical protein GTO17_04895 [Candidatus Aminicenantes bacterium]|nr:hypothetical protein [Candidatus Aminicenantes bacterium]